MGASHCEVTLEEPTVTDLMTTEQTTPTRYTPIQQTQTVGGDGTISCENSVLPEMSIADVVAHVNSNTGEGVMDVGGGRQDECMEGDRREMEGVGGREGKEQEREGEGMSYEDDQRVTTVTSGKEQRLIPPEFSFEDGSVLQDYPSSTDLEVRDDSENTHRARFLGERDIYNSWILQTDSIPHQEQLKECSGEQSIKSCPAQQVKERIFLTIPALVAPQANVCGEGVGSSETVGKGHTMPPASPSLEEAQKSLDKSDTVLLEPTNTLPQRVKDSEDEGCSTKEYQSLCDNTSHLHKVTPHAPPYHGSVPCLTVQVAEEDAAVRAPSSPFPHCLTYSPKMQASQSINMLEWRVPGELNPDPDTGNTLLSTAESDDLLLISHV